MLMGAHPQATWARSQAFPLQILCGWHEVFVGRVIAAEADPTCAKFGGTCSTRSARLQVKVERSLGRIPSDHGDLVPGSTRTVTVDFNPSRDGLGTSPAPNTVLGSSPQAFNKWARGKEFVFGTAGSERAITSFPSTETWIKGMLESASRRDAHCPRPDWITLPRRYFAESLEVSELMTYSNALLVAKLESDLDGREPDAADNSTLLKEWREVAAEMLSDAEIDQLLIFYRSRVGKSFIAFQHRLQPIVAEADRGARQSNGPPPSRKIPVTAVQLVPLALTEQQEGPYVTWSPPGVRINPGVARFAAAAHRVELNELWSSYGARLSAFQTFRRSAALRDFLEAGAVADGLCRPHCADPTGRE
jgi:hypothetical protein